VALVDAGSTAQQDVLVTCDETTGIQIVGDCNVHVAERRCLSSSGCCRSTSRRLIPLRGYRKRSRKVPRREIETAWGRRTDWLGGHGHDNSAIFGGQRATAGGSGPKPSGHDNSNSSITPGGYTHMKAKTNVRCGISCGDCANLLHPRTRMNCYAWCED
jgi:hypothetical protein